MSLDTTLTVSLIVPVHRGSASIHRCLASVTQAVPPAGEIIVVVDGETDEYDDVESRFNVRLLKLATRGGPARARNAGAFAASGDILFFVDSDVTVVPHTVQQVVAAFEARPGIAALIGSYDDTPSESNFLSQYKNLLHHYTHQTGAERATTFWGACGAIRRDVFLALGGFDEKYLEPSIEDIELGYRLISAGYKIHLEKSLQVKHLKHWSWHSLLQTDFFGRALPWTMLILRDQRFVNDLNLKFSSRLSVALVWLLPIALAASIWQPAFMVVVVLSVLALFLLNSDLYRFLRQKRGTLFALQAVPWHWLYFFYSGLAFVVGILRYFGQKPGRLPSLKEG